MDPFYRYYTNALMTILHVVLYSMPSMAKVTFHFLIFLKMQWLRPKRTNDYSITDAHYAAKCVFCCRSMLLPTSVRHQMQ